MYGTCGRSKSSILSDISKQFIELFTDQFPIKAVFKIDTRSFAKIVAPCYYLYESYNG